MVRFITLTILSSTLAIAYMSGRYWVYDKHSESEWSDTLKLLYIIIDTLKDIVAVFLLLEYLLR